MKWAHPFVAPPSSSVLHQGLKLWRRGGVLGLGPHVGADSPAAATEPDAGERQPGKRGCAEMDGDTIRPSKTPRPDTAPNPARASSSGAYPFCLSPSSLCLLFNPNQWQLRMLGTSQAPICAGGSGCGSGPRPLPSPNHPMCDGLVRESPHRTILAVGCITFFAEAKKKETYKKNGGGPVKKKCLTSLETGVGSGVCAQIVDLETEGCAEWL